MANYWEKRRGGNTVARLEGWFTGRYYEEDGQ